MSSIASNNISLVHLYEPAPRVKPNPFFTDELCDPLPDWGSELYIDQLEGFSQEFTDLGISLRKIGKRFRDHHSGLKTRVRIISPWSLKGGQAFENGDLKFFHGELEKEAGGCVTFELVPRPDPL